MRRVATDSVVGVAILGVVGDLGVAEVSGWAAGLEEVHALIAPRFACSGPRARVVGYLRGLLAPLERKNGWTLAEDAGEHSPDGMQRLLTGTDWDADRVRDDLRGYVLDRLGDPGAVLVVDGTGFLKKGAKSAGVARQYSGTAGRVENCQVGVFLGYAAPDGRTFLDRELYLPKAWTADRARCREAGIDDEVALATKPELAIAMLTRALDAGVPAGWLTGDEVYGRHPGLRGFCAERGLSYVLVVPANQWVWTAGPKGPAQAHAKTVAAAIAPQAFKRDQCSRRQGPAGPQMGTQRAAPRSR